MILLLINANRLNICIYFSKSVGKNLFSVYKDYTSCEKIELEDIKRTCCLIYTKSINVVSDSIDVFKRKEILFFNSAFEKTMEMFLSAATKK